MRRHKKTLVFLICLFFILATVPVQLFAAGGKEEAAGGALPTITFYFPGNTPKQLRQVLDEINVQIKDEVGAKLEFYFYPWADLQTKLRTLVAAGDTYEASFDAEWFNIPYFNSKGALLPLEKMLPVYAPNVWKVTGQAMWDACTLGGHIVAIPWKWPGSERPVMIIRQDLYEKYGLPKIDTEKGELFDFADYEKFLKKVKENNPELIGTVGNRNLNGYGFIQDYGKISEYYNIMYDLKDPKFKLFDYEKTQYYKDLLTMMRRWYVNGYIEQNVLANTEDPRTLIQTGRTASIQHGFDMEPMITSVTNVTHPEWKFKTYLMRVDKVQNTRSPLANAISFNAKGAHPIQAMKFIEWMHKNQDNYDLVMYGIKGKHWVPGPNNYALLPPGYTMADSPYMGWDGRWAFYWAPEFERRLAGEDLNWRDRLVKGASINEKYFPNTGFVPDWTPIKNEVAQYDAVQNEMGWALQLGVLDPVKVYDDYIAKKKAAGVDKIIAELQKQFDAFTAGKKK